MVSKLFSGVNLSPRQLLSIALGVLLVTAALSFGSYALPEKKLTGRRGPVSFIPRDTRKAFVERRGLIGAASLGGVLLLAAGWMGAERLSRVWQKRRNEELAANAVLLRLSPRVSTEKMTWESMADLWWTLHSTLARPQFKTWLGGGLHMSFEIARLKDDKVIFYLWAPRPLAQTLVDQFSMTYTGIEMEALSKEVKDGVDDYLDTVPDDVNWQWMDMGLTGAPWRPLRSDYAGNPLPAIIAPLNGLSAGNNIAAIHFIVRPATGNWQQGGNAFVAKLRGDNLPKGQPRPRLGIQERALIRQIEEKGVSLGYELCLRLCVAGKGDTTGDLDRMMRSFDQFNGDNRLGVRRQGDQSELYRIRGRYFPAGWRRSVVSHRELNAMAHLPIKEADGGDNVAWAGVRILPPTPASFVQPGEQRIVLGRYIGLPAFDRWMQGWEYPLQFLRNWLGMAEQSGTVVEETPLQDVGIFPIDARRHFHVIGPTGVGKSTILLRMLWQYIRFFPEASVWLQEPHQDLTHNVILRTSLWREKDVIWLDVMDKKRSIGINPFYAPGMDIIQIRGMVIGAIKKVMGANWESATRMQAVLKSSVKAVLQYEEFPTMVHVLKLLMDENYRFEVTSQVEDSSNFWGRLEGKKERELNDMFEPALRRIDAFLENKYIRRMIVQAVSTVNFRQAIDTNKIILIQFDRAAGEEVTGFLGTMMMYQLFGALMSRADIEEKERRQTAIFVDEFQTFIGQSGKEFGDILEQARKMGASLTLAHQHLKQLEDLTAAVANNTGVKVVFRAEASDAPTFLKWLPRLGAIEALTTLANYRAYVRPMVHASPQAVCTLATYPDPPVLDRDEELRSERRGDPDPLPPRPDRAALLEVKEIFRMASDQERTEYLINLDEEGWQRYRTARRYYDAVRRNRLIKEPERIPDKLARVRELSRLGYGTPHFETEAYYKRVLEN